MELHHLYQHSGLLQIIELRILLVFMDILISKDRYPRYMHGVMLVLRRNLNGIIKKYQFQEVVNKLIYVIGSFIRIDKMINENKNTLQTFSYARY